MKGDQMGTDPTNPSLRELPLSNQTRFNSALPNRCPAQATRLGRLERHRGRRPRRPARACGLARGRPALGDPRRSPGGTVRLDEAAHPLDEALYADLPHARPTAAAVAARAWDGPLHRCSDTDLRGVA